MYKIETDSSKTIKVINCCDASVSTPNYNFPFFNKCLPFISGKQLFSVIEIRIYKTSLDRVYRDSPFDNIGFNISTYKISARFLFPFTFRNILSPFVIVSGSWSTTTYFAEFWREILVILLNLRNNFATFWLVFLCLTGCFYLEYNVLCWLLPFSRLFFDG